MRKQAFGAGGIAAEVDNGSVRLRDLAGVRREVRIVFDDGSDRTVVLDRAAELTP